MKKTLLAFAVFAAACFSMGAFATPQGTRPAPVKADAHAVAIAEFQQGPLVAWMNTKAGLIACRETVTGFDASMDQALASGHAQAKGVALTKTNFQATLQGPKAMVMDELDTVVDAFTPSVANCRKNVDAARSLVQSSSLKNASF